jgi:hypothetical protein
MTHFPLPCPACGAAAPPETDPFYKELTEHHGHRAAVTRVLDKGGAMRLIRPFDNTNRDIARTFAAEGCASCAALVGEFDRSFMAHLLG